MFANGYGERLSSSESYKLKKRMLMDGFTKLYGMSFEKSINMGADGMVRALWSYETPIADYYVKRHEMYISMDAFRCSNTTIRHFSEWLKLLGFDGYYHIIKKAAMEQEKEMAKMYIFELTGEWYEVKGLRFTFI